MSQSSVPFTSGPPETLLSPPPASFTQELTEALERPEGERRAAVAAVAAHHPRYLDAWARLADLAFEQGETVESYAYARVGYHRGLDALRAEGWRGSGYVRWTHESNRGFLGSLDALRRAAGAIGEAEEEARCELFLAQLDPDLGQDRATPGSPA